MKTTTLRNLWAAVVVLGLGAGCGGNTVQVKGRVTDGEGTQPQALLSGAAPIGGSGTVAATTQVRASTVGQDGKLTVVAEAKLEAQGSYTLDVPAGEEHLVLQAVDASGQVVASALLEATAEGQDAVAPPMDGESSLESEIFLQMAADTGVKAVDMVDVRARITANMAAAARQGATTSEAFRSRVKALADAVRAAQQAELEMYAKAGVQTSQSALFQEELAAAAALNVALDAGTSVEQAYDTFHARLQAAAEKLGAKVEQQAQSERAASASFRATVKARLSAEDARPLVDAALRASAGMEARASGAALSAILSAAGAADDVKQQAATASATLRAQVRASTSAAVAAQAFTSFGASVASSTNVQTSVLGQYLGVNVTNQLVVSTAVSATVTAAATLDATLDAAASAAVSSNAVDVTMLATKTAEAYQAYAMAVRAQASALSVFGTKSTPAVELLLVADGSFQMGQ